MDMSEKGKFLLEKRGEDHLGYDASSAMSADWRLGDPSQMDLDPMGSSSSCTPASMADSFAPLQWGHPASNPQILAFDAGVQSMGSPAVVVPSMPRGGGGGIFLQNGAGVLSPSLTQFPTDSAFIERAARFSCFNSVNFGGPMNPFGSSESLGDYAGNAQRCGSSGAQGQKNEAHVGEASQNVSISVDAAFDGGSPLNSQRDAKSILGNPDSSEPEVSGGGREETPNSDNTVGGGELSSKGLCPRKRTRGNQEMELDEARGNSHLSAEASKQNVEGKRKGEQKTSTSPSVKPSGKNGKDGADASREDYIHVRARRGQATNSHSLAERLRREKISERMKFLQDLVPGCSKVTGKAVMLDEIINYVQSLQRQVEFLSMKLAAVNPRLDFNIEGLLSKEIVQTRGISSSAFSFSPDMTHPQIHQAQQGLVQSGIPGIGNPSDAHRRSINAQLAAMNAYKEPASQIPHAWDEDLHNVVQMGFGSNAALNITELRGLMPPSHMKAEP